MSEPASNCSPIPCSRIDTSTFALEDRFDAWREFDKVVSDIEPDAQGHRDPKASATHWQLGDVAVAKKAYGPHNCSRGPSDRQLKWNEFLRLRLYEAGSVRGLYGDSPMMIQAGDIHLTDMSIGFRTSSAEQKHITVLLPYEALGYDPSKHPAQLRISVQSAKGRVLEAAIRSLAEQMETATIADAKALAQGIAGLVRGMLLDSPSEEESRAQVEVAQETAMRKYIEEHLDDLSLGAETLCKVFHASRATVYRNFGEVGGVSRYVKERRLDRAFSELAGQPATRGCVRAVAERWGFFEAGHFNRVFRQRFGLSPSEVAALGEVADGTAILDAACGLYLSGKDQRDSSSS